MQDPSAVLRTHTDTDNPLLLNSRYKYSEATYSEAVYREATYSEAVHREATYSEAVHREATYSEAVYSEAVFQRLREKLTINLTRKFGLSYPYFGITGLEFKIGIYDLNHEYRDRNPVPAKYVPPYPYHVFKDAYPHTR